MKSNIKLCVFQKHFFNQWLLNWPNLNVNYKYTAFMLKSIQIFRTRNWQKILNLFFLNVVRIYEYEMFIRSFATIFYYMPSIQDFHKIPIYTTNISFANQNWFYSYSSNKITSYFIFRILYKLIYPHIIFLKTHIIQIYSAEIQIELDFNETFCQFFPNKIWISFHRFRSTKKIYKCCQVIFTIRRR